jgi:hypothetical protein
MTVPKYILPILFIILLLSCGRTRRFTDEDYSWMPYTGKETLVFTSNRGRADTVFCIKKDTLLAYPEAQSLWGIEYEVVSIFCRHTDKTSDNFRYLENSLVELHKSKDGKARLQLNLSTAEAKFYKLSGFIIDSLEKVKPIALYTKYSSFQDVYVLDDEDWLNFKQRSNYVTKIYWSKKHGIVRYDKQDGTYWELANKYGP